MSRDLIIPMIGLNPLQAAALVPLVKQFITDWTPIVEFTNISIKSYDQRDTMLLVYNATKLVTVDEAIYALIVTELRLLSAFQGMYMIGTDPLDVYLAELSKLSIVRFQEYVLSSTLTDLSQLKAKLIDHGYRYIRHANVNLLGIDARLVWTNNEESVYQLSPEFARRYPQPDLEYIHQVNVRATDAFN